ncbi:MAG TPA: VWA domain-containing protein [Bryobacteraceae bacterium]|nr:VWA domain-containing protein [Bryobacteraceae bacterium]
MNRRTAIRSLMVAGAVSWIGRRFPAAADDPSEFIIHSDVRLVLLDVSVKDRDGGFVAGLSKADFQVFENGMPQQITVFGNNDIPVTVGLVVDSSLSMMPKRAAVVEAASTFVEASNPHDEIFVLNFNDTVRPGLPAGELFSDNVKQLRAAIFRGLPEGRTALNDAVMEGLQQLELGKEDKKTLIVISDGGDNASKHTHRQMMEAVERSIATIYTIGLFEPLDPDRNPHVLSKLANVSGGIAYFPDPYRPKDLAEVCREIAKDIRTRYTLGYNPPVRNGGNLRRIHVTVSAPGRHRLIARTRSSYRYDEAAAQTARS